MANTCNKRGFTLLESIIAMILAASGLSLTYQGLSAATRLQSAINETAKIQIIAENILTEARLDPRFVAENRGSEDGVHWQVHFTNMEQNDQGLQRIRIEVLARAPSGRSVQLHSEILRAAP